MSDFSPDDVKAITQAAIGKAAAESTTKSDRVYHGSSVKNGLIRYTSVSQIKMFDAHASEGCQRRWAFRYPWQKEKEESGAMTAGSEIYAKSLEHYLKSGEDTLVPVLRAVKHLFPEPRPHLGDLEVEQKLGDLGAALVVRDALLRGDTSKGNEDDVLRLAGLTAAGVPVDGAVDFRHQRQEYIDGNGLLRKEDSGMYVIETGDLKTTSRVSDHVTRTGTFQKGNAKTVEQILDDTQMLGYGKNGIVRYPNATHHRLSHVVAQTRNGLTGVKRTGLLTVDEVLRRVQRVDAVVREMIDVAAITAKGYNPELVPANLAACNSYHRECPHISYCPRAGVSIVDMIPKPELSPNFDPKGTIAMTMGNIFLQNLGAPTPANGTVMQFPFVPPLPPPAPATPTMSDAEHAAAVAAEKAKLTAGTPPEVIGTCTACNGPLTVMNSSRLQDGKTIKHVVGCTAVPIVPVTSIAAVNPPDSPPRDPVTEAAALPPTVIAAIADDEIRARAQLHADETAARAAAEKAAQPGATKTSGNCPSGGTMLTLTDKQKASRKYVCPTCAKEMKIKDSDFSEDFSQAKIGGHRLPKDAAAPAVSMLPVPAPGSLVASIVDSMTAPVTIPVVPTIPEIPVVPAFSAGPEGIIPMIPSVPVSTATAFSQVADVPPPIPQLPPGIAEVGEVRSMLTHEVIGHTTSLMSTGSRSILIITDAPISGATFPSLDMWAADIVRTVEKKFDLEDIRLAPNNGELGYGRWRGYLSAAARANVPASGTYVWNGVASSEVKLALLEGLESVAVIARGSNR